MATIQEIAKLALYWSEIIQTYMETVHSTRLNTVPKGDPDSIASLLATWDSAIPNTYPAPTEEQLLAALTVVEANIATAETAESIETEAEAGWNSMPDWARWTPDEAEAWIEMNVTDLASAKNALKKMARAIMWLADKEFPNRR